MQVQSYEEKRPPGPTSIKKDRSEAGFTAAELPILAQTALLDALETGNHAIGLFDSQDRLAYSNSAFREGWAVDDSAGVTFDSMIRHCYFSRRGAVVETDDIETWLALAKQNRRYGVPDRSFEVDLWDGRWMWLSERRLDNGWILFVAQDITKLKASERTLKLARDAAIQASLTDPLTGLPNRRSAFEFLYACVERNDSFHLAIADVDNFKQINDRFGHLAGDDVLVKLSSELRSLQLQGYFVGRLAGDEFVIIGPDGEPRSAFERNLQELLQVRVGYCASLEAPDVFAISVGAATFPVDGSTSKEMLIAADSAMYRAKMQGRCMLSFAP